MQKEIYAKSNGITLLEHSIQVAQKAQCLAEQLTTDKGIISCSIVAALFHDIGKCTKGFQKHIFNDVIIDYIPHNILSASIFYNYLSISGIGDNAMNCIIRAILYHHPTNFKKFDFTSLNNISMNVFELEKAEIYEIEQMVDKLLEVYNEFNCNLKVTKKHKDSDLIAINDSYFIYQKEDEYKSKQQNSKFFIISNIVKFADFIVSSGKDSNEYINGTYPNDITFVKPSFYDNRFNTQMEYAEKCSNYRLSLFDTQTGFGKTLMGVRYLLNNGKKGYWICPRNTIAEGLYQTITKELKVLGLHDKVSVALLLTNEWIYGNNECDIIVTNIDNFVRPSMKADANIYSFNMLYCNCIFDEFHEYVDNQAIMALFDVALDSRFKCDKTKTLLLSATPIMNFVKEYKNSEDFQYFKYDYEPILSKQIKFSYGTKLELDDLNNKNWLVSVNSVRKSQEVFKTQNVDNIIHARYMKKDLSERLEQMYDEHGKGKNIPTSWVATNILSTGIDVSFGNMIVSWPTPERFIQSGGRCNRWNECKEIPMWHIVNDKSDFVERCGVDSFTDAKFAKKFYEFLTNKFMNNSIIALKDLYDARIEFYQVEEKLFKDLFKTTLTNSRKNLQNLSYEYSHSSNDDDCKYISKKCNIRKDKSITSFFFKVKYDTTQEFIEEPMQGDNITFNMSTLTDNTSLRYIKESIENVPNWKDYFKSLKIMDRIFNKHYGNFWDCVFSKATCSKTPLLIGNNYYYNKQIGLFKSC